MLTLRLIENPFAIRRSVAQSAARSLALGGVATAAAVFCLCGGDDVDAFTGWPRRTCCTVGRRWASFPATNAEAYEAAVDRAFAQVQAAVAAAADQKTVPSNLNPPLSDAVVEPRDMIRNSCLHTFFEVGQPECATGDTASATTVALVGDSNATMWRPALEVVALQQGWRLDTLTKSGCPPMDLPVTGPVRRWLYTNCTKWRGEIIERLSAKHPRLVVLSIWRGYGGAELGWQPGFTSYDPEWMDSLTRLVRQFRGTGAQVLVLGPIPDPHSMVAICVSGHLDEARQPARPPGRRR